MSHITKNYDNQLASMSNKKLGQSTSINERVVIVCGNSTTLELQYLQLTCAMFKKINNKLIDM